jgi:hypothetical protein
MDFVKNVPGNLPGINTVLPNYRLTPWQTGMSKAHVGLLGNM